LQNLKDQKRSKGTYQVVSNPRISMKTMQIWNYLWGLSCPVYGETEVTL